MRKDKGSFSLEAAFVILALAGLGFIVYISLSSAGAEMVYQVVAKFASSV